MNTRSKILVTTLALTVVGLFGAVMLQGRADVQAGIYDNNQRVPLMSNYFVLEGEVGDVITDFELSIDGALAESYFVNSPTESIRRTTRGLEFIAGGEGNATFRAGGQTVDVAYKIEGGPEIVEEVVELDGKQFKLTANGEPLTGAILYINDSKNAFKIKDTFVIPESLINGETHTLYLAKFTKNGPVAYKITEFTSMAGEVSFKGYNQDEVKIEGNEIILSHTKSGLI